jgi:poly [ADP-ribose] polymerase
MSIVKENMLIMVSAQANNNKFYHVTLNSDGQVIKRWGRVGAEGASSSDYSGENGYDKVIREKLRKGYKVTSIVSNVQETSPTNSSNLSHVAKSVLSATKGDPTIDALIEKLVAANRHEILKSSGGLIKINPDGVITTPLGFLGQDSITEAEKVLRKISRGSKKSVDINLLNEYLQLVPQKVPHQRGWQADFFSVTTTVTAQFELLKQLKDSITWYEAEKDANVAAAKTEDDEESIDVKYANLFRSKIGMVDEASDEFARVKKLYESTRNSMHSASRLQLKRVFTLTDTANEKTYSDVLAARGNERELWHGSRTFNVLSILRAGLFCPPISGTSYVTTGRMFGDGIYFAPQSSKSLMYSTNYWGGGTRDNNCFMFLADVALGQEFRPKHSFDSDKLNRAHYGKALNGKPYNSISIKGGTCNVHNDEIIVWDTDAIKLKYLCEFSA